MVSAFWNPFALRPVFINSSAACRCVPVISLKVTPTRTRGT